MNGSRIIGAAIIALIIIVVIGAYVLIGGYGSSVPRTITSATTGPTTAAYTTVAPITTPASANIPTVSTNTTVPTTTAPAPTVYTVELENSSTLGTYLANSSGYTLYTYANDVPNSGTSACTGGCASLWPPFYTSSLVLPAGLNASNFATIARSGGSKQLTYKGYPLYLFSGDTHQGQTNGENVNNFKVAAK